MRPTRRGYRIPRMFVLSVIDPPQTRGHTRPARNDYRRANGLARSRCLFETLCHFHHVVVRRSEPNGVCRTDVVGCAGGAEPKGALRQTGAMGTGVEGKADSSEVAQRAPGREERSVTDIPEGI